MRLTAAASRPILFILNSRGLNGGLRVDVYKRQEKELEARRQVEEAVFRRKHPTVAEYCEKWLLMQSAKAVSYTHLQFDSFISRP